MTTNKRAKQDTRGHARKTGEPYVLARRRTARGERYFEPDCCANCLERLPDDAVVREVNEETGLLVERIGPLGRSPGWGLAPHARLDQTSETVIGPSSR